MSEADILFIEMGYVKVETERHVKYTKKSSIKGLEDETQVILLDKLFRLADTHIEYKDDDQISKLLFPDEILAVYEKSKELGWFDKEGN